jgi:hypothetical protein
MLTHQEWYQVLLKLTQVKGSEEPPKEGEESEDDGGEGEGEEEEGEPPKGEGKPDTEGLQSALRKERQQRKQFEKELRQLRALKEEIESKDATETDKAKKAAERAEEKATKLAARLRAQAVDITITKFASQLNFQDINDALVQLQRDSDWVDQDDDDPSEIEVDEAAVEKAVKALADKKKYLLKSQDEKEPSGSKFGGGKNNSDDMDEETLRQKYPALRQRQSSTQ